MQLFYKRYNFIQNGTFFYKRYDFNLNPHIYFWIVVMQHTKRIVLPKIM
ncbi:hypothetical protein [Bacillus luti]